MTKWICLSTSEIVIYVYEIIIDICEITCYYYHVIHIHEILTKNKTEKKNHYINFKITITKKEKRRKGEQGNEQWIFQNRHAEE